MFIVDEFEQGPTIACFSSAMQFIGYISRSQSQSVSHYSGLYVYPSHWSVFCTSWPSHSAGHYLPHLDIVKKKWDLVYSVTRIVIAVFAVFALFWSGSGWFCCMFTLWTCLIIVGYIEYSSKVVNHVDNW